MSANAPDVTVIGESAATPIPTAALPTSEGVVTRWWIPALHLMVLGGMALAMFLFQLGTADWEDGMESIGGHIVEEIVEGSGWVLPLRNGRHMPLKPPLFHWFGALSAQL